MKKLNMIVLTGQGDTDVMLVDDEIMDWVESDYPLEEGYGKDPNVPASVRASMEAADPGCEISIGLRSFNNDRALYIGSAAVHQSYSLSDTMKYIRENDIEITRDWEGYIY
jgi:hypothetical protein